MKSKSISQYTLQYPLQMITAEIAHIDIVSGHSRYQCKYSLGIIVFLSFFLSLSLRISDIPNLDLNIPLKTLINTWLGQDWGQP